MSAVLEGVGTGYRPRGDEFAVLIDQPANAGDVLRASVAALSESDRYYSVVASGGYAVIPTEATGPDRRARRRRPPALGERSAPRPQGAAGSLRR